MKHILLLITGSIAACKSLDLIRLLKKRHYNVTCVLTKGGEQFVTPLSVSALSGNIVYSELFSLKDEIEMGHIQLSRVADIIVIAPASADILAKMAAGLADDLASTLLLASDKPIIVAPAMNVKMWEHKATKRNIAQLIEDGVEVIGPKEGILACGEMGAGRMVEPEEILEHIERFFAHG